MISEKVGYAKWQKFENVLEKAQEACRNAGCEVSDHFTRAGKMIELAKGAQREVDDYMLTRYEKIVRFKYTIVLA